MRDGFQTSRLLLYTKLRFLDIYHCTHTADITLKLDRGVASLPLWVWKLKLCFFSLPWHGAQKAESCGVGGMRRDIPRRGEFLKLEIELGNQGRHEGCCPGSGRGSLAGRDRSFPLPGTMAEEERRQRPPRHSQLAQRRRRNIEGPLEWRARPKYTDCWDRYFFAGRSSKASRRCRRATAATQ